MGRDKTSQHGASQTSIEQETFTWEDGSQESVAEAYVRLCAPANVTGLPALTVPFGKDHQGLPIGGVVQRRRVLQL
ncbi:amidase family protein [Vreelandella arcis]|uniref:amidase family protein n=1 Tax=Vreelandella arcis TaxID=416873 RepID=UPI000A7219C9|nr:amidase family protein [Halomonas arcis]